MSDLAKRMIKRQEGLRTSPYDDRDGKRSIFWGHQITKDDPKDLRDYVSKSSDAKGALTPLGYKDVPQVHGWRELAERAFSRDYDKARTAARGHVPTFSQLNPARQAALTSMAYNLGSAGMGKFKNFLTFMREGDYKPAAAEMKRGSGPGGKSKWSVQVPSRVNELSRMIETGQWSRERR